MTPAASALAQVTKYHREMRRLGLRVSAWRDFPTWARSQGRTSIEDGRPWLTLAAARQLAAVITPDMRVLEFGSGGSTVYFDAHAAEVVSVEHDPAWASAVARRLNSRATLLLREPTPGEAGDYGSTDLRYSARSFRAYAEAADGYPDGYFDLLLIDGRARPATFSHGYPKVRSGGWVILDDSYRGAYASIFDVTSDLGWPYKRYAGPTPFVPDFGETTIWQVTPAPEFP